MIKMNEETVKIITTSCVLYFSQQIPKEKIYVMEENDHMPVLLDDIRCHPEEVVISLKDDDPNDVYLRIKPKLKEMADEILNQSGNNKIFFLVSPPCPPFLHLNLEYNNVRLQGIMGAQAWTHHKFATLCHYFIK